MVVLLPDVVTVCVAGAGVGEELVLIGEVHPAVTTANVIRAAIANAAVTFR